MISSPTLCNTVSPSSSLSSLSASCTSSSFSFIALPSSSSFSPPSSVLLTLSPSSATQCSSSPSALALSSSLLSFLVLILSTLFLPLRLSPHRARGSHRQTSPSSSPPPSLWTIRVSLLLVITASIAVTDALPIEHEVTRDLYISVIRPTQGSNGGSITAKGNMTSTKNTGQLFTTAKGFTKGLTEPASDVGLDRGFQADQPPRKLSGNRKFDPNWAMTQGRAIYLVASNGQFLMVYNGHVFGTTQRKPELGMFETYKQSDEDHDHYLIKHFLYSKYLCMDSNYQLYLDNNAADNCFITQKVLGENQGAHKHVYTFTRHKRYLGIDCDPVNWVDNEEMDKSPVRFHELSIKQQEVEAKEKNFRARAESERTILSMKCVSATKKKEAELRRLRKSQQQRWCWSLPRMENEPEVHINNCKKKYSEWCSPMSSSTPGKYGMATTAASATLVGGREAPERHECVCVILQRMLAKPKRAKRKCLVQKVDLWVQNQIKASKDPLVANLPMIKETAKLLIPHYKGIARRMRETRCLKKARRASSPKKKCRKRLRGIKINGVLKQFKDQLILKYPVKNRPIKPSEAFAKALEKLGPPTRHSRPSSRSRHRHRRRQRRRDRARRHRKHRSHKTGQKVSSRQSATNVSDKEGGASALSAPAPG